jgi:16S rRNA processing protein RimM
MRGDPRIEIGGIARAHGIKGEVVIITHDPDSDTLSKVSSIYIDGVAHPVEAARNTPQRGWLVKLADVHTRNDAEALQGKQVQVDRAALELDDDDVILDDMVGCEVRLPDGTPWGTIDAIDVANPHQALLVIIDGDLERLLPLVDEFVTNIDLDAGVVTVDPPEDLPASKVSR